MITPGSPGAAAFRDTSAGWVAGGIRARLLARRRLGRGGARRIAREPSLDAALAALAATPYRRAVHDGMSLRDAQQAVSGAVLIQLQQVAGWLPPGAGSLVRDLVARWELANLEGRLLVFAGGAPPRPFSLDPLGDAWPRAAAARSIPELRAVLAVSAWGDPGSARPADIIAALRLRLAERLARHGGRARRWAAARALVHAAADRFLDARRPDDDAVLHLHALGAGWDDPASVPALAQQQPRALEWVLDGIADPRDLWIAESRWWRYVEQDAAGCLRGTLGDAEVVLGAIALLSVDAWRVRAALAFAARGGAPLEAFDAVV